jgi:hypothetical protein
MKDIPTDTLDVQEALKILRFRFHRKVAFRPSVLGGARFYLVDCKLRPESEILTSAHREQLESARLWTLRRCREVSLAARISIVSARPDRELFWVV